ncbi:hypothetical protein [Micromonospora sp. NPDC001898]|uniref:hypothetical protein n=1 Tax=Micromonospora sp. NPDC001898 TaxID=3364221 RepID=UPI0036A09630
MAHGEAEYGCAQGETRRPGHHDPQPAAEHHRRLTGPVHPVEPTSGRAAERAEDDAPVPRQRTPEPLADELGRAAACCSDLPGWAGAHRHGPVRPRHRAVRRERPPRRWC